MVVGKRYENEELRAYAKLNTPHCVEYGFFDEKGQCVDPFYAPPTLVTHGYHYEKGGNLYRRLCEWIASLREDGA